MECLMLRRLGADEANAVEQIAVLGLQLREPIQKLDDARAELNKLSAQFPKATPEGKEDLKKAANKVKTMISYWESTARRLQDAMKEHEGRIPNIPSPDCPLPSHLTPDQVEWKRILLRRVHRLIAEENGG
jgi:seryl-tRNA synthetase